MLQVERLSFRGGRSYCSGRPATSRCMGVPTTRAPHLWPYVTTPGSVAAEVILELERWGVGERESIVGTVGDIAGRLTSTDIIPEELRISLYIRGLDQVECLRHPTWLSFARWPLKHAWHVELLHGTRTVTDDVHGSGPRRGALSQQHRSWGSRTCVCTPGRSYDTMCLVGLNFERNAVLVQCVDGVSSSPTRASVSVGCVRCSHHTRAMHSLMSSRDSTVSDLQAPVGTTEGGARTVLGVAGRHRASALVLVVISLITFSARAAEFLNNWRGFPRPDITSCPVACLYQGTPSTGCSSCAISTGCELLSEATLERRTLRTDQCACMSSPAW